MTKLNRNDVLEALGFTSRRTSSDITENLLPALGLFGAGMIVGAGVALMMAPKPGRELRADVYRGAGQLTDNIKNRIPMGRGGEGEHAESIRGTATQPQV